MNLGDKRTCPNHPVPQGHPHPAQRAVLGHYYHTDWCCISFGECKKPNSDLCFLLSLFIICSTTLSFSNSQHLQDTGPGRNKVGVTVSSGYCSCSVFDHSVLYDDNCDKGMESAIRAKPLWQVSDHWTSLSLPFSPSSLSFSPSFFLLSPPLPPESCCLFIFLPSA